jgi:DNA-binding NarL/FixJ family response regulator
MSKGKPVVTTVLVADGDATIVGLFAKLAAPRIRCVSASSAAEALDAIARRRPLHGLVVDVRIGGRNDRDRSGLRRVLDAWQRECRDEPAFLMTGHSSDAELINHAFRNRCRPLAKPFGAAEIRALLEEVEIARTRLPPTEARAFLAYVAQHRLSTRQAEFFALHARHVPRGDIARQLDISPHTVRTRDRQLIRKVGAKSLQDACDRMLLEAERRP